MCVCARALARVCVCVFPTIISFLWLFVCLWAITYIAKIDQAGRPESFFNFVWPNMRVMHALHEYF